MKKYNFFLLILLVVCFNSYSQFNKYDFKAGLSIGIIHSEPKPFFGGISPVKVKFIDLDIHPSIGIFTGKQFELGIRFGFNNSEHSYRNDPALGLLIESLDYKSDGFSPGIFGNKYFIVNDIVSIILSTSLDYSISSKQRVIHYADSVITSNSNVIGYSLSVAPGISVAPVKKLLFTVFFGDLGFNEQIEKDKETKEILYRRSEYGLHLDTNTLIFGINYIF